MTRKKLLVSSIAILLGGGALTTAHATEWTTTYTQAGGYANADGATGSLVGNKISTIKFDDWGYTGPNGTTYGQNTVVGTTGFDVSRIGQLQHVVTLNPDYKTPDAPDTVIQDITGNYSNPASVYSDANMDASANFYDWGYSSPGYDRPTTPGEVEAYRAEDYSSSTTVGSRFNNMQIDLDGNYNVAKEDMNFGYYDKFVYLDTATPGATPTDIPQNINFQPYATSDATGWCGSVMASHPAAIEAMAGKLQFDFAFDVNLYGFYSSTNIAPEFQMASFGTLNVDVWNGGVHQTFTSDAVINNTNPDNTDRFDVDSDYANMVSFHGAGVLPDGVWLSSSSSTGDANSNGVIDNNEKVMRLMDDGTVVWDLTVVPEGTPGAYWHGNAFAGYAWILRADGIRLLDWYDPSYGAVGAVPVPAAVWLFGSGLLGLIGVARKNRKQVV